MEEKNTKIRIMQVATNLFAKYGYSETSTRDICKVANINVSLISYYFGSKENLYDEIIRTEIKTQNEFILSSFDYNINLSKLSVREKINILSSLLQRSVDYIFTKVKSESVILFLREQQSLCKKYQNEIRDVMQMIVASIMQQEVTSKEVVYAVLFLTSQILFPFLLSNSTLSKFNQDTFNAEDILIIKKQVEQHVNYFFAKYL